MSDRFRIYLAGPDVFRDDAEDVGEAKKALCAAKGMEGLYPLDQLLNDVADPREQAREIYDGNISSIRVCDGAIVEITPFRGESADVGTAYELGYLHALDKPVVAYTTDQRLFSERCAENKVAIEASDHPLTEEFDLADNLMIGVSTELYGVLIYDANGIRAADRALDALKTLILKKANAALMAAE